MASSKIFCIGFHKTGTTSLYAALSILGKRVTGTVAHHWRAEKLAAQGAQYCIDVMKDFDAAEDMPWPLFYRELDEAYPQSKFILTVRDPSAWYESVNNHFGDRHTELNAFTYGAAHALAQDNREHWIQRFVAHNEMVRAYFKDRPRDCLELDLSAGDGWEELCPFLECDIVTTPFPVKNTRNSRTTFQYRLKRRLWLLAGRTPHPERLL